MQEGCVVCGEQAQRPLYTVRDLVWGKSGEWAFVTCACCGHGSLHPRPDSETLERFYREFYTPENLVLMRKIGEDGFESALQRSRLRGIQKCLSGPVTRVLDLGAVSGSGNSTQEHA